MVAWEKSIVMREQGIKEKTGRRNSRGDTGRCKTESIFSRDNAESNISDDHITHSACVQCILCKVHTSQPLQILTEMTQKPRRYSDMLETWKYTCTNPDTLCTSGKIWKQSSCPHHRTSSTFFISLPTLSCRWFREAAGPVGGAQVHILGLILTPHLLLDTPQTLWTSGDRFTSLYGVTWHLGPKIGVNI